MGGKLEKKINLLKKPHNNAAFFLLEHVLGKDEVTGSNPVISSTSRQVPHYSIPAFWLGFLIFSVGAPLPQKPRQVAGFALETRTCCIACQRSKIHYSAFRHLYWAKGINIRTATENMQ